MLKHSIIISLVIYLIKKINILYENSLIHKILMTIGECLKGYLEGSLWGRHVAEEHKEDTLWTMLFRKIVELWNTLVSYTGNIMAKILNGSNLYTYVENFETVDSSLLSMGFSLLILGFFTSVISPITRRFTLKQGFFIFFMGFLFLLFSSGTERIIKNAKVYPLIRGVYNLFIYHKEGLDDEIQEN